MTRPILTRWTGEAFEPANAYQARIASQAYEVGQAVPMAPFEDRSRASHNHNFAWVAEAWNSLPEEHACQSWAATPEHLRKYALIRTGFCNSTQVVAGNHAAALRVAAAFRSLDEYALVTVDGQTVTHLIAQSQSMRAMGKRRFQESKTAILEYIADLLGVEPGVLVKQDRAA
jgi:hypothetical protein